MRKSASGGLEPTGVEQRGLRTLHCPFKYSLCRTTKAGKQQECFEQGPSVLTLASHGVAIRLPSVMDEEERTGADGEA